MFQRDLLSENEAAVQRFLSSNYFASENLVTDPTTSSLTWERVHAGFAPVGMLAFVNNAVTSATRRSTMSSCDSVISTLDDAVKALSADTSPAYTRLEREVAGESILVDAEVLETLQPRTKERPDDYVGLKHVTYRTAVNLGNGLNGEDYVLIETIGRDVDPDGYAFAFKMLRSVDVPGVFNHVDKTSRASINTEVESVTRRGNLRSFMVILSETKFTGLLRMQLWVDVDLPSNGHGVPIPMDSSFASLHDALSLGLRYRRLIERSFAASVKKNPSTAVSIYAAANLTPMSRLRVTQCQVCERKLGLFTRKRYSCDVCKASLCSTCAKTTDMCSWRLCVCCYGRSHSLFSRQIMSKLTSPFSRLSSLARRSSLVYRQSIVNVLPARQRASKSQPVVATVIPYESSIEKDSRRTSSSDSSISTTASTSQLANSSISTLNASSSMELDHITELEDDRYERPYMPSASYTDGLSTSLGVKLLDQSFLDRYSASSPAYQSDLDDHDVEEFLLRMSMQEMAIRESLEGIDGGRHSLQVL